MSHPEYAKWGSPEEKLIEECAELIQAISKAQRFGLDSYHPIYPSLSNREQILQEMSDVEEAIQNLKQTIA